MKKIIQLLICGLLATQASYGQAWINEIHYDNENGTTGGDIGEFIEVFVPSSYTGSLNDLRVSLYNGSDNELYGSNDQFLIGTDFTEGDTVSGEGTFYSLTLPTNGIQNGSPDGIALSLLNGGTLDSVIQFLSYEGVIESAGDGDAIGLTSVDIGVSQDGGTPVGSSLGLQGAGAAYEEFSWAVFNADETPGSINTGQTIGSGLFVEPPAAGEALATDATTVELTFTGNGSDDILIVSNETGTFTEPSGAAPAVGQAFAGGTVVYEGATSPVSDIGLVEGIEVFYAFYSVTAADLYSTGLFDSAVPGEIVVNEEDFEGTPTWVNQTVSGTDPGWDTSGGDAFINGFGETTNENHYLVSPALDFSTATEVEFEFEYQERFNGPNLQILYSMDYTGSGDPEANGTWTAIPFTFTDIAMDFAAISPVTPGTVALPSFLNGVNGVYLAFKYTTDADAENWIVDNLQIFSGTTAFVPAPEPSEQASSFAAASGGISSIDLTWTDAGGAQAPDAYLILANDTGIFTDPVDGVAQATDSDLSDNSAVLNVLQGTESASFNSLLSNKQYFFKIFAYTNAGTNIDYNLTPAPSSDAVTDGDDPEPTDYPTAFTATASDLEIALSWADASGAAGYLILANTSGTFTPPVDGVDPVEDTDLTDGSALLKVNQGEGPVSVFGSPGTQYFFTIYPYSNIGLNIDFKTDGVAPTADETTGSLPNLIISEIMYDPLAAPDAGGEYIEIYNAESFAVDLEGFILRDDDGDSHVIASSVTIPAQRYVVLGRDADPTANGNLSVDYGYGPGTDFQLSNSGDEVVLVAANGVSEIDRVEYSSALNFPGATGASLIYTGGIAEDNNDGTMWVRADAREPGFIGTIGDLGSPGFTGTGQILPSLTFPANTNVVADTATSAIISFEATFGNDVVIVSNTTGEFTDPAGAPPSIGQSFAGGTLLYVGQSSPLAQPGLTPGVEVFYAFYSITPANEYSPAVLRSVITGLISVEDFSGNPEWTNQTVEGDDPWDTSGGFALADGADLDELFNDLDPVIPDNHYLVSPELDLSESADVKIAFDYGEAFDGPDIQLVYSTNYTGSGNPEASGVVWTSIPLSLTDGNLGGSASPDIASGDIDLSVLDGLPSVYLAFIYTADGTGANSEIWVLDNIVVFNESVIVPDPLGDYLALRSLTQADLETDTNDNGFTVIEEYLAGFGDGVGPDALEYGIDLDPNLALTLINDRPQRPLDIIVELQATSDLTVPFETVEFFYATEDNGDNTYTHSYIEATPPAPAGDTRFLRLRITEGMSEEDF